MVSDEGALSKQLDREGVKGKVGRRAARVGERRWQRIVGGRKEGERQRLQKQAVDPETVGGCDCPSSFDPSIDLAELESVTGGDGAKAKRRASLDSRASRGPLDALEDSSRRSPRCFRGRPGMPLSW
ncbi:uncharacterized protein SPSK_10010 [Sporothrix schenckii 1099-18]|uniref:Uncharacterized protein n=1 Tax=Sporothrix schenckii 1099-18 TaxID=1397361 RepID=A0A0F2M6J2_SPOSC|nr:uncharacterized protein SPSK_10010 [Sporothrix schenckii 1099-18]KJR84714.1 hypothetical protein SPSK_10010 [Sporothrix schenckii 1099-18]